MVKRLGNVMSKICTMPNIIEADCKARKAKRASKKYINKHDLNLLKEDLEILHKLYNGTYKTSEYSTFTIHEPKERLVYRLPYYPDRIVHHAIMNILKTYWEKSFVRNTYSCIEGRGIHKCLNDIKKDMKKFGYENTKYCLKLDIKKFYPSIDHEILKTIIARKIKDTEALNLLYEIIDSVNRYESETTVIGKGVPIGNYLSQYFANIYLTPFDHYITETLKCKAYYRYADDIVILGSTKEHLRSILNFIIAYLDDYKLLIKGNYQIFPVDSRGIDFIGYVIRHRYIRLRKSIKNRCLAKARTLTYEYLDLSLPSYYGWFIHGDCKSIWNEILTIIFNRYGKEIWKAKAYVS